MLENIKHLLKHSFIYSISNIALKASGVILLPLYTIYFSVEEYGRLGLILISIIVMSQSLILGQGISLIRYNNDKTLRNQRESIFFTLTVLVIAIILLFILLSTFYLEDISSLLGDADVYSKYLNIAIFIAAAITINNLFLSKLRADESLVLYTVSNLLKVLVIIVVNIYLILYKKMGIESVLYAQLAGEITNTIFILPRMISQMKIHFKIDIIGKTIKFGLPLVFSAMAINLLNGSDRFLIKFLIGETELGLYELGYKIAGIMNMFIIIPFGMTLLPIAYKLYKKEGDKRYYLKLKTYMTFIFVWAGLSISLFSEEIVKLFAMNPSYYTAYKVVPLIVLAYTIYGMSMISSLGMYLTGKNHFIAYITILCAALNIGLNFWLIPQFGMMGAAFNTVISFAVLDILSNLASNKYYKIYYEYKKLIILFTICIFVYFVSFLFDNLGLAIEIFLKLVLIIIFPIFIIFTKYFDKQELKTIIGGFKKWRNPINWKKNLLIEISKTEAGKED